MNIEESGIIEITLEGEVWSAFDSLRVEIDEPDATSEWGGAKECDEEDNSVVVDLSDFCP